MPVASHYELTRRHLRGLPGHLPGCERPRSLDDQLHLLSLALAFAGVRLLAAANNLLLVAGEPGPLGVRVRWIGARTSPAIGLAVVMGGVYVALALAVSPLAARLITLMREPHNRDQADA